MRYFKLEFQFSKLVFQIYINSTKYFKKKTDVQLKAVFRGRLGGMSHQKYRKFSTSSSKNVYEDEL